MDLVIENLLRDVDGNVKKLDASNIIILINDIVKFLNKKNIKDPNVQEEIIINILTKFIRNHVDDTDEQNALINIMSISVKGIIEILIPMAKRKCLFC
jgi:hypothetical protein